MFGKDGRGIAGVGVYARVFADLALCVLEDLFAMTARLAVAGVFFGLMVFVLPSLAGVRFDSGELRMFFIAAGAFVVYEMALCVANTLVDFVSLEDMDDSDTEEV